MTLDLKLGSSVWKFDEYRSRRTWRDGWTEHKIVGETRVSWLVGEGYAQFKIAKRDPGARKSNGFGSRALAFSQAEIDDIAWVNEHRYKIYRLVEYIHDAAVLRQIARLVNYVEEK